MVLDISYILLYGIGAQNDNIGHSAHFGGAIGGVILTLFYDFDVIYNSKLMLSILCATTLVAGFLLYIKRKKIKYWKVILLFFYKALHHVNF